MSEFKPASSFEVYLLSIGYIPHQEDFKRRKGKLVVTTSIADKYRLSSMGYMDYKYIRGDNVIVYGLNETKKPPTIKWPKPRIIDADFVLEYKERHNIVNLCVFSEVQFDDVMSKTLHKFTNKEVHDAIFDRSIILNNG